VNLVIVDTSDAACHITTIADMAARPLDLSHLPEFAFSPRKAKPEPTLRYGPFWGEMPVRQGPPAPPIATNPRTLHPKREVLPSEECRIQLRSMWGKTPNEKTKPPLGTAPTLDAMGKFVNRAKEIMALKATQCCTYHMNDGTDIEHSSEPIEVAKVSAEMREAGLDAIQSSSPNDDDMDLDISDEMVEHHASRYGTAFTDIDLAPMVRLVEREQFFYQCGPVARVWMTPTVSENEAGFATDDKKMSDDLFTEMSERLFHGVKHAKFSRIENGRLKAAYYKAIGSATHGVTEGPAPIIDSMDDLGAEDLMVPDTNDGGEEELGLHNRFSRVVALAKGFPVWAEVGVAFEPSERALWPEDYPREEDEYAD
jgi:hypothetical protein